MEFRDLSKTWSCECPSDREILGLGACGKARMYTTATIPDLGQLTFLPSFTSSEKISCGVALRCTMYNVHYDNVIVALSFNNDNILSFRSARCPGQPPCKPEIKI